LKRETGVGGKRHTFCTPLLGGRGGGPKRGVNPLWNRWVGGGGGKEGGWFGKRQQKVLENFERRKRAWKVVGVGVLAQNPKKRVGCNEPQKKKTAKGPAKATKLTKKTTRIAHGEGHGGKQVSPRSAHKDEKGVWANKTLKGP